MKLKYTDVVQLGVVFLVVAAIFFAAAMWVPPTHIEIVSGQLIGQSYIYGRTMVGAAMGGIGLGFVVLGQWAS